jgi:hypothetical protein
MNTFKVVAVAGVAAVVAVAVIGVSLAFAQGVGAWGPMGSMMRGYGWQGSTPVPGEGVGMMGGQAGEMMGGGGAAGMMDMMSADAGSMQAMHAWMNQTGGMHAQVWGALAPTLGLTPEALQAELADGRTLTEIAEAQGVDTAQLAGVLEAAMQTGLKAAVADGALTQTQADQMLAQMAGRYAWMVEHMTSGQMNGMMSAGSGGCHAARTPDTDG